MSAARAAGRGQGAGGVSPSHRGGVGGVDVGGAALCGAAPLDEAAPAVRVLLRLQGGGGEDVGGQPPQLIGPRVVPLLFQLQTDQSERGRGGVNRRNSRYSVYLKYSPTSTSNTLI